MKYKKISELTNVVTGGTPSTSVSEYWDNGNIAWLQSGCCQNCIVNESKTFITQKGYDNSSTKMMPKNTILIALTGATAGKVGYLNFEACGNQSITGILPSENLNPKYLFYFLQSYRYKILSDCVGGAQPHISQQYVKNIDVPYFTKIKQNQIADELESIDIEINYNKQILNRFNQLIKSQFAKKVA